MSTNGLRWVSSPAVAGPEPAPNCPISRIRKRSG
jgi:hypothetical protein